MTINCKPEDRTKLMPKQEKHKCVLVGNLAKAPRQFVDWPSCLWDADTEADETNWILKCETENRIKYFASRDTAILWIMRYLVKGVSVKKAEDREKISERLDTGIKIGTRYWGVRWTQNIPEERIEE